MGDNNDGAGVLRPEEVNLQDIIRNRNAERRLEAEQKRQVALQRIRDMRSNVGIHPLERFPKEIWIQILNELGPEDRGNVWQVHHLFRDLMESTHVQDILLPLVLKVDEFHDSNQGNLGSGFHEKLRLISKSTKESFDQWMNDALMKRIRENEADFFESNDDDIVNLPLEDMHPSISDERQWHKDFIACFAVEGETPGKCFFPRGLGLSFSDSNLAGEEGIEELIEEYQNDISSILKNIGDQIWHFRFFMNEFENVDEDIGFEFSDVYPMLHGWISLMPNLKWLELSIIPSDAQMTYETEDISPFPCLPQLERLSLHSGYMDTDDGKITAAHNIYGAILASNQHIKMLDLTQGVCHYSELVPRRFTQDLNLTWLTVCDEDWYGGDFITQSYITLENVMKMMNNQNWPLQQITLTGLYPGHEDETDESTSIVSVFRFLQQFPTSEKVDLKQLHEFNFYDVHKMGYLELPNLTELGLGISRPGIKYSDSKIHFFFSLQFLVHCKKLKTISWKLGWLTNSKFRNCLEMFEKKSKGEMVDFRGGMRYLYDSNIWEVFPYLETVDVYVKVKDANETKGFCEHKYLREEIEGMSVGRFLNSHRCSREKDLRFCVMLMK